MSLKAKSLSLEKNTAMAVELISGTAFGNLVDMATEALPLIDSADMSAYYVKMLPAIAYAVGESNADPSEVDWIGIADLLADTAREVDGE